MSYTMTSCISTCIHCPIEVFMIVQDKLCIEGHPWGTLQKLYRWQIASLQGTLARLLLVHNTSRCSQTCMKVCCQRNAIIHYQLAYIESDTCTMSFCSMGDGYPWATRQHKFLLLVIDYFTKWIEAELLARIIDALVKDFVWKSIICQYGIPLVIITNNGCL